MKMLKQIAAVVVLFCGMSSFAKPQMRADDMMRTLEMVEEMVEMLGSSEWQESVNAVRSCCLADILTQMQTQLDAIQAQLDVIQSCACL